MLLKKSLITAVIMVLASLLGVSTGQANLIANGSFEIGTDPGAGWFQLAAGSTYITSWSVVSGSIDYVGTHWQASDGQRSLDLDGWNVGRIEQSFPSVVGTHYYASFDFAANPEGGTTIRKIYFGIVGDTEYSASFDVTGHTTSNMGWVTEGFYFTATGTTSTIYFGGDTGSTTYGPTLDNVRVELASSPVPPTVWLLGSSLLGLASWRRLRKG
jgi:choice-of-anchor C domain-containing protein